MLTLALRIPIMNAFKMKDDGTNFIFEGVLPAWIEVRLHQLNAYVRPLVSIMLPFSVQSNFQKRNLIVLDQAILF